MARQAEIPVYTVRAFAKLNFGLQVLCCRPDGYHDLSTVFYPIGWSDTIFAEPAAHLQMSCTDPLLPVDDTNLVVRAAQLLAEAFDMHAEVALHLEKRLPMGAGIGGGSSDAAATLRLLCNLWQLDCSGEQMQSIALTLGSDVPFFLYGRPAHALGRGEIMRPMMNYFLPYTLVVAVPPVHIATSWAFGLVQPNDVNRPDLEVVVRSNDLERWRRELSNDFEQHVFAAWPCLRTLKDWFMNSGAGYASLTGTGSAVFGVFEDPRDAITVSEAAKASGHRVWMESPLESDYQQRLVWKINP